MIADLSHYQGDIDWSKASKQLDFCILRATIGERNDDKFVEYTENCRKYNVPYGAYHYVIAGTQEKAEIEAEHFYKEASKQNPLFYVADIEYEAQNEETTDIVVSSFYNKLRELGAKKIGLYANRKRPFMKDSTVNKFDFLWVPRYGLNNGEADDVNYPPKYSCDLWQYTSRGSLDGVKGNVDLNKLYGRFDLDWFISSDNNKFTNTHFAEYCKKWVGRRYWYGTVGYKCTDSLYKRKKAQYPSHYTSSRAAQYQKDIANKEICADCVGLIKSYAWTNGGDTVFEALGTDLDITNKYQSNGCPDRSANGMFEYAKAQGSEWGTIDTIPDIPGIAVRYDGHVGVYVGNGEVVEERGFNYGCQLTKLQGRGWLHWYKLPFINYTSGTVIETKPEGHKLGDRLLKKGMKGEDVKELQNNLLELGYSLPKYGADSDYGSETVEAVKAFQKDHELDADGEYGQLSHKALMRALADLAPDPEPEEPVAPQNILVVNGGSVRVRYGDSTSYEIITTVFKDAKLTPVLNEQNTPVKSSNGWYAIRIGELIGWISGKYIDVI